MDIPQEIANTSGMREASVVPPEARGWSWGAFLLTWIWGVFNGTFISLLMFIPLVNVVMWFVLGAKGREWAWRNKRWESVAHFQQVQHSWGIAGVIVMIPIVLIGGLAILSAVALIAINPAGQFAKANNTIRASNVMTISAAIEQHQSDYGDNLPISISTTPTPICTTIHTDCTGKVNLGILTDGEEYLYDIPIDPLCRQPNPSKTCDSNSTGYTIAKASDGRITVAAPLAELEAEISVTK